MRFSSLITRLSGLDDASPRHLGSDPDLSGAEALDRAAAGQLSFLEPGNALAAALAATGASAVADPP
jgi:UDP-3-O-[3-hydroxymyristoyl] glucosamine N-acyltransferase